MTSNNTYMSPSERNHRLWFIFYMLDKRASSVEAARKLMKGVHNIMSNGKVMYPKFQISKNSELVAATQNHIMEVHGPNPKGATTSCFYMIVEF
jgi:phosphoribosylanthranilate isomerase